MANKAELVKLKKVVVKAPTQAKSREVALKVVQQMTFL